MAINERTDLIKDEGNVDSDENESTWSMDQESKTDTVTAPLSPEEESSPKPQRKKNPPAPEVLKHLNDKIINQARDIRKQWNLICERIDKIESSKGSIKNSVYAKVLTDYKDRLETTRRSFLDIKADVDRELMELRHKEAEATQKIVEHEDILKEAEFRHELGEYKNSEFKEISQKEVSFLSQAQEERDSLQEAIALYEEIFIGIEIEEKVPEKAPEEARPSPPPAEPAVTPPSKEKTILPEAPIEAPPVQPAPPNVGAPQPRAVDRKGERVVPPSEEKPSQAMLLLYENGQAVGQFKINGELTIGRSPNNEVVLKEPRVSRRHAVIRQSGNQYVVVDNNSSNGTYVNGHTITEQVLRSGDKIQIGTFELVFTV